MANQPILFASFNQDNSRWSIGNHPSTSSDVVVWTAYTLPPIPLCGSTLAAGAFIIVEMLFSSSLLAIVGAGEQPSLSPRRLCLFNTVTGVALEELNFLTSILAVRMNKKRLIVILQEKTFIYDINSLKILDTIDTVPNPKGLCAFSPSLDGSFLALPASTTKGSLLVYNVSDLRLHCEIDAHRSPLAVLSLSSGGTHIATASEQGTMVRVHLVADATKVNALEHLYRNVIPISNRLALDGFRRGRGRPKKYWGEVIRRDMEQLQLTEDMTLDRKYLCYVICFCAVLCVCLISRNLSRGSFGNSLSTSSEVESYSFRRGSYPSNIFSLSFAPAEERPDILLATSSSGSVHVFSLGSPPHQRSSGLLGSIKVPHTVSDALDPAQHCILHRAVPAGLRSTTLIRKIEKFDETATPEHVVLRATISMITYGGYFLEYVYNVNHQNKSSWTLEREFNLLTAETSSVS
ncbi:Autophagy-related protein 18b [Capsicum annuum]|nr:Autophagy-related protein 18b [Capsicum annuum]